jgi:hypothetical protein
MRHRPWAVNTAGAAGDIGACARYTVFLRVFCKYDIE